MKKAMGTMELTLGAKSASQIAKIQNPQLKNGPLRTKISIAAQTMEEIRGLCYVDVSLEISV